MTNFTNNNSQNEFDNSEFLLRTLINKKQELLSVLEESYYYQNDLHPQIMFAYDNLFGDLENEISKRNQTYIELKNQLDKNTLLKKDKIEEETKSNIAEKIENIFNNSASNSHIENDSITNSAFYYRSLVKKLHPDVSYNKDDFKKFWNQVQFSYKNGNLSSVKLYYKCLCESNEQFEEIEIKQEIKKFDVIICEEKRKIKQMLSHEPFSFASKMNDQIWINDRRQKLMFKLSNLDYSIQRSETFLARINNNFSTFKQNIARETFIKEGNFSFS